MTNQGYPHQTTLTTGQTRVPQTLHEHYMTNPMGCANYVEFCRTKDALDLLETFLVKWHNGQTAQCDNAKRRENVIR
jgi:hypothetical protein